MACDGVGWGKLLGTRGVEEEGRGLLDVVAGLGRVVRRELGEEPRPEAPGPRPELARVRDHESIFDGLLGDVIASPETERDKDDSGRYREAQSGVA